MSTFFLSAARLLLTEEYSHSGRFGASHISTVRTDNTPKVRFSATVGEELEIEVAMV
jgi:hypothetical protein